MPFWTIEEVADALGMTVAQVYETRRRKEYPGALGKLRGRRLMFDADLVQAGPQVPESTEDVSEAILWTLQGIEDKLASLVKLLAPLAQPRFYLDMVSGTGGPFAAYTYLDTTTTEEEE